MTTGGVVHIARLISGTGEAVTRVARDSSGSSEEVVGIRSVDGTIGGRVLEGAIERNQLALRDGTPSTDGGCGSLASNGGATLNDKLVGVIASERGNLADSKVGRCLDVTVRNAGVRQSGAIGSLESANGYSSVPFTMSGVLGDARNEVQTTGGDFIAKLA